MSIKRNAFEVIISHLKSSTECSASTYCLGMDEKIPTVTIVYEDKPFCPDKLIESCLWFRNTVIEARVYYTQTGQKWVRECGDKRTELLEVINFINARIFPAAGFSTPRLYITEECDISYTMLFDYGMFDDEDTVSQTLEFLTEYMPAFLDTVSPYIFSVVGGAFNSEEAIKRIKSDLLDE
ncbi:MAG: hypothetical protein ACI4JZ_06530, partial [Oscillospiraceae bacterium]